MATSCLGKVLTHQTSSNDDAYEVSRVIEEYLSLLTFIKNLNGQAKFLNQVFINLDSEP